LSELKKVTASKIFGVVKANAYGHGAVEVAKTLERNNIDGLCVALISEIKELRKNGITSKILHLGRFSPESVHTFDVNTIATINHLDDVKIIQESLCEDNKINVHLKVDTGMCRMGIPYDDFEFVLDEILKTPQISIKGIYSHFSTADEDDNEYLNLQYKKFNEIVQLVKSKVDKELDFHIANSSAMLKDEKYHYTICRPGISLYGVSPIKSSRINLNPVMEFKSTVVLKKKVKNGESIGYNRKYIAKSDIEIAIIQVGYADGIPTSFANNGFVYANNMKFPIIGKVSMDLITVDCTNSNLKVGDKVTLWGNSQIGVETLSAENNEIPYTFFTRVSQRVKRKFIHE
jgi:alanine racemase